MKSFLSFVAGVSIGIAISWKLNKNKYEEMVQEEVESLREFKNKKMEKDVKEETIEEVENIDNSAEEVYEEEMDRAKSIIDYNKYSNKDEMGPCERAANKNPLYVITPEDFASQVGYDTDTFYIFEDDIITDDNNQIITNVEETFGMTVKEIRSQFGIYEDASVYVRNERIQMDYEILREIDTYEKRNGE